MFDGALGAVAALECLRRLHEEQADLRRPVRGVAFADEEGSYLGFLGSKGLVHGLDHLEGHDNGDVAAHRGPDGRTLAEAVAGAGGELGAAREAGLPAGTVRRFVELHIEQGPLLEASGTNIGVVTHIVGVGRLQLRFEGRPDHAGTTPMHLRRDALRAAAAFIDTVLELPARCGHPAAVITCGDVDVRPGAPNVVPHVATVHVDFRAASMAAIERLHDALVRSAYAAGARHGIRVDPVVESITPPVRLDPESAGVIEQSSSRLGLSHVAMPSGAGHDAQVMAEIAPTGMIFVPSRDGRSHSRLEHTSWDDITNGAEVLLNTLLALAGRSTDAVD